MDMKMNQEMLLIHPLVWSGNDERDGGAVSWREPGVTARIGAHDQEQGRTQRLRINRCVALRPPFDWGDRLDDVLDYDRLRQAVLDLLAQGHITLLETLGER